MTWRRSDLWRCVSATMAIPVTVWALALVLSSGCAQAQWRQFGGPDRNFRVDAKGLAGVWPEEGPRQLWRRELGDGYSTIIGDGGVLYTMYRPSKPAEAVEAEENKKRWPQEVEITIAIDAATGQTIWEHKFDSPYTDLMAAYGPGPHSTPLIVGPYLYTIGTNAVMHCFDKKSGKVIWKRDLVEEFGAPVPGRGYGNSPIAYGNTIIVGVDRKRNDDNDESDDKKKEETKADPLEGQSLVAFDQRSGSVIWKSQDYPITYASPLLINFEGEDQLVMLMRGEVMGVNPKNGKLLWHFGLKPQGVNLSSPLWNGKDLLFCSSAYDSGSRVIKLTKKDGKTVPEQLWYSRKMRVHHGNVIGLGNHVYGSSGDTGPAFFMAVNFETGKIAWRQRGFKKATCLYADDNDKMIILDEEGDLALASVSPEGMTVHSRVKIGELYAWVAPTLIGTKLYVRDRKHITAFDLGS